ncbi:MAG: right-handed parallel beta-helix repeat-containing protein [Verrucomicrobia bacterium]|nr:right-handed parallel beta-helix repeat-containing protein [Verrucomicrobiota bacterium]
MLACFGQTATYEVAQRHPQASDEAPGTAERPWKTIGRAAAAAGPGDLVVIRGGVYRERVLVKASGTAEAPLRFEAAPGEHVLLTGADRLTGWRRQDESRPVYSVAWPHRFITWNRSMTHPDDEYHRLIGRCEQVIVDGLLLRQVLSADQLAPGAFFADVTNRTLLLWDVGSRDPNRLHVETSVRQEVLRVEGDHVQVRGLRFRHAANMAQHGAVVLAGRHNTLEDCVVEAMNASGATFSGEDATVRRCAFRDNGQMGFGAGRAHRLLFTDCLVENNNTKGFDRGWEAGGNKLALCQDVVLERSRFVRNRGNGVWFDIGNTNCTVRQCLIADNEDAGIFYEISFALHAHDNVIVGNGFAPTSGAWGAQAGISLSSSPGCLIERNLIVGNREGFNFREQPRTTPTIEDRTSRPVWNHDQLIRHNVIALNRDAQVWGWFDVKDNRHWPAGQPAAGPAGRVAAAPDGGTVAAPATNSPVGLTLEQLRLQFVDNVYFAAPGQAWFEWGPTWAQHQSYPGLTAFQSALAIDTGGQVLDPGFVDVRQGDFRLRPETRDRLRAYYPRGPVPGVILDDGL